MESAGYDIAFHCFQKTPRILTLSIESVRISDLLMSEQDKVLAGRSVE